MGHKSTTLEANRYTKNRDKREGPHNKIIEGGDRFEHPRKHQEQA